MVKGLTNEEVAERIVTYGYNELPSAKPKTIWRIALEVLKEPMFLLLISCATLYMILGDYREGAILLSSVLIIIFIAFYQHRKTERALDALKKLSSPRALVIRGGVEMRIPGREVVPDDIILLNEGDRIAADAVLIDSLNLIVDESLLTGESVPVTKSVQADSKNHDGLIFSGTVVVQGKGMATVIDTGIKTQFGQIGRSLEKIEQDETKLQKEMKVMIKNLFIIGAIVSVGVVAAYYFSRGNFFQSLLNGLAAAMAILPEEFPVVLTVFLALGAWRLSKQQVLTRKPSAIETLGSATVLCSDKTGTITQNKMKIAAIHIGKELVWAKVFRENSDKITALILTALRASQKNSIDPMEKAVKITYDEINSGKKEEDNLIKEYPLSKHLLAITRITNSGNEYIANCKGAPEAVFNLCKMNADELSRNLLNVQQMAEQGYRVIAAATATCKVDALPDSQAGFDFMFLGLLAFEDPIRPEVPQAIKECNNAGIRVIMITGDFPSTAKSIASQIGMNTSGTVITGVELKDMNDDELRIKIQSVNIFARVIPEQKLRIVEALKANKEIVAMTGDGVNDSPALKAANIGIAMGNKGTDVAREASSLVLLDDNFASIVSAMRSGRRIFDNLQKAMSYIMAIHIPIIGLTLLPAIIPGLPLLLMPVHIVFMELIIDPVCSIAFESEQEEYGIMNRPPRNPDERFFGIKKILFSLLEGLLLLAMVVIVYFLSIREGHTEREVRTIAFSAFIIGNIFLILNSLSKTRSFIAVITEKNVALIIILAVAIGMLLLIIFVPALQNVFSFSFPGYSHFISSITGAIAMLFILETIKYFKKRKAVKTIHS